ncbi:MAG: protein-L-isoaspartate(D-aspartate) O-methyltransferase [Candidatus Puniceispirillaceae bacterium]
MVDDDLMAAKAQLIMKLRAQAILDSQILAAIERVPREAFLPKALRAHAYENASLPIAFGQTISQPFVIASSLVALDIQPGHRVLEIGTGTGYQACVLSYLARRVYSVERLRPLFVDADLRIKSLRITNVTLRHSDGHIGWPEAAPFDRIITACQSDEVPTILLDQLKEGGIFVGPVGKAGAEQLVCIKKLATGYQQDTIMDVRFVPMVKGTTLS